MVLSTQSKFKGQQTFSCHWSLRSFWVEVTNNVGVDHDTEEWFTKGDGVFVGFHTCGNILTISKDLRVCVCHGTYVEIRRQLGRVGSLLPLFGSWG